MQLEGDIELEQKSNETMFSFWLKSASNTESLIPPQLGLILPANLQEENSSEEDTPSFDD